MREGGKKRGQLQLGKGKAKLGPVSDEVNTRQDWNLG